MAAYKSVTAGRTLLNCAQLQFDQFADPDRGLPRTGLLEDLAEQLNYSLENISGLWYIHDAEGTRFAEAKSSKRAALNLWWVRAGQAAATKRREEERAWESMPGAGRPVVEGSTTKRSHERSQNREAAYRTVEAIWADVVQLFPAKHAAVTSVWLNLAMQREIPRQHQFRSVGVRRAVTDAVRNFFDVERTNLPINDAINGLGCDEDAISAALLQDLNTPACNGDAAACMPRIALAVAVQLSPHPAEVVYGDLLEIMKHHGIENTTDLNTLCDLAQGQ